jgi:anaerobic magnesium-protoporphyrin IX monomethyl ester cyclase
MKVLFINPNTHSGSARPPLGLLSVATVCKQAGHEVKILDANLLNLSLSEVCQEAYSYPVIALTAMTPVYHEAKAIAEALFFKRTILGGVHASIFPEECIKSFDCVVAGEGEHAILTILDGIQEGKPCKGIYDTRLSPVNLNELPLPDYSLIEIDQYKPRYPHGKYTPWTTASTSRGCIYHCRFCSKAVFGKKFRALSPTKTLELISRLQADYGIRDITFYDDLFTCDLGRVMEICHRMINRKMGISWTCESRVNMATPEALCLMEMAGCRLIYYGLESGNQTILRRLNKGTNLDQIRLAVKLTQEAGIQAAGYFMLGAPGETPDTIQQTLDFAKSLNLDHAQFSVCSPLPGSRLYQDYIEQGNLVPDWHNCKYLGNGDKPMFTSGELSKDYIEKAVNDANEMFSHVKV